MAFKIAFCAGHGYNTAGKRTPDGEREWSFNNKVALAFEEEMKKYEGVELLRTDDRTGKTDVPLSTRTNKANSWGATIYISFHHNANTSKWGSWTGVETFYCAGSTKGLKLAQTVHPEVVKAYGLKDRGLKTNNLHITREAKMPAILIEGGFMDSTIDIKKLRDDNVLRNAGIGVARAVAKYGGLKLKSGVNQSTPKPSQPTQPSQPTNNLYRVRKSWEDVKSQIGAYSVLENAIELAKANKGYNVYDSNGKQVYPTVSKPESTKLYRVRLTWEDVKSQIGAYADLENAKQVVNQKPEYKVFDEKGNVAYEVKKNVEHLYRVRKSWADTGSQIGAYKDLQNAKDMADSKAKEGYKVFDENGVVVYTPKVEEQKPAPQPTQPQQPQEPVDPHKEHTAIQGKAVVEAKKMIAFVKAKNPNAQDIEEIAKCFIEVGNKYNIRGDIAFCQSIIETGWFKFDGGTAVTPDQHNYCGLGVTSKGVKGNSFTTVKEGVTAQIQHLYAYACKDAIPNGEFVVDPRFSFVIRGVAPHWEDLSNRWAMNSEYGNRILAVYKQLVEFEYTPVNEEPKDEAPIEEESDRPQNPEFDEEKQLSFWKKIVDYLIEKLAELFGRK